MAIIPLSPERRRGRAGKLANLYCLSNSRGALKEHVIFLHGLGGHPYRTWQATRDEKSLWPRWLAEERWSCGLVGRIRSAHLAVEGHRDASRRSCREHPLSLPHPARAE